MAEEDVVDRLERGRAEEDGADRDRAEAERRQPQRCEHDERPEEERGEEDEPGRAEDRAVAERADERRGILRARRRRRGGVAAAQATSANEATASAPNVQPIPAIDATPPTTGPKSAPATAAAKARADQRARRFADGAAATSQPSAPVHVNALATPCRKRARSSCQASWRARRARCRARQSSSRPRPRASRRTARRGCRSGSRRGTRPPGTQPRARPRLSCRARARRRSGAGAASAPQKKSVSKKTTALVSRAGCAPSECTDRLSGTARARLRCRSAMRVWIAVHPGRPRASGGGAGGDGVPARRPRLGARGRHEPVGRRGLRAPRLRLPQDPRPLLPAHDASRSRSRDRCACSSSQGAADGARSARRRRSSSSTRAGASCICRRGRSSSTGGSCSGTSGSGRRCGSQPGAQPLQVGVAGYRGDVVVRREARRADGRQRAAARPLPARRRPVGGAEGLARGDVRGAGGCGALVHARDAQARQGLRPLPRHALADVRRDRAERPQTNLAIGATAGQVLDVAAAASIAAFYFSTSGGRTSSVHDAWPKAQQVPYLVSVADPYDYISPHHVWPTTRCSARADRRACLACAACATRSSSATRRAARRRCGC